MLSTQGQRYTQSWRSLAQDTPVSLLLTVGHINVNLSLETEFVHVENHWLPRWWTTLHSLHNFCNSSTVLQPAARDTKKVSGHGGRRTHKRTSLLQGSWRHYSVSGVRRVTNHPGVIKQRSGQPSDKGARNRACKQFSSCAINPLRSEISITGFDIQNAHQNIYVQ